MAAVARSENADTTTQRDIDLAIAEFGSEMYGLALSITANVPDAEDAYQAAWLNALGHWTQLRDPDRRRSWLASIVSRSALRIRHGRAVWFRRHPPIGDAEALAVVMDWDPAVAKALMLLTERQRAVVALHYGHGYSLDETAAVLGCRGGTVRSHLARALTTLRRSLRDDQS
jgi:RNA polymerase sigma-70 factor (ECF subfamily)